MLITRSWYGRPIRENGKNNIDAGWFNGDRIAGMGSYSFTKIAEVKSSDFTAAALNEQIEAFSLQAKERIVEVLIRPTTKFEGGGATSVAMSLGVTGTAKKFFPIAFDVFQIANVGLNTDFSKLPESWSATTQLYVYLESDVNVADLTAGEAEIYVATVILP